MVCAIFVTWGHPVGAKIAALGTKMIAYFDSSVANVENADRIETLTKFNNDQLALQASYQVYAKVRQLSLTNFM